MSRQLHSEEGGPQIPCRDGAADCDGTLSAPAHHPLRQALGSNHGDIRLPSLLLSLAALAAIVARVLRRRSTRQEDTDPV